MSTDRRFNDEWRADVPTVPGWYWFYTPESPRLLLAIEVVADQELAKIAGGALAYLVGGNYLERAGNGLWQKMHPPPPLPGRERA